MKIDRLVNIIIILLNKKRVSAKELSEHFEVSLRTIYRDIDTINLAGIPICATPGSGGGFEIMENFKIEKKLFSKNDFSAIIMGLSNLSHMFPDNDFTNALTKVQNFIPENYTKEIEIKTNQIHIDLSPWIGNKNIQSHLTMIKNALQTHNIISFEYINNHGKKTSRCVEPYRLILKNSHWYFQGYCLTRNDFRLFKLTRMTKLQILEKNFILRSSNLPQLDFTECITPLMITIKIRIHKSVIDRILDYCSFENFSPDGADYYIVNLPFIENDYYYDLLLSLGNKCECLEPLHVRTHVKELIHSMYSKYQE